MEVMEAMEDQEPTVVLVKVVMEETEEMELNQERGKFKMKLSIDINTCSGKGGSSGKGGNIVIESEHSVCRKIFFSR